MTTININLLADNGEAFSLPISFTVAEAIKGKSLDFALATGDAIVLTIGEAHTTWDNVPGLTPSPDGSYATFVAEAPGIWPIGARAPSGAMGLAIATVQATRWLWPSGLAPITL